MERYGMYGDPAAIRELGMRAESLADQARQEAARTRAACEVSWVSSGADRFRAALETEAARLERSADQLDRAAHALRQHADAAQVRLDQIAAAQRWFNEGLASARSWLAQAADTVTTEVPRILRQAPLAPPPGSLQWLEFTRRLGR